MLIHTSQERLHVVTVYFGNSPLNQLWLELQQKFLDRTTNDYKFSVFLNHCDQDLFQDIDILGVAPPKMPVSASASHLWCLKEVLKLLDKNCGSFLILDSDCFPIKAGWQSILADNMSKRGFKAAAPMRVENLDVFPHPSALFTTINHLEELEMIESNCENLIGTYRTEPTCNLPAFPLIRTNKINIHPIGAAIYYDMFYHHGAGSRTEFFENVGPNSYFSDDYQWHHSISQLKNDPIGFIEWLRGANLSDYKPK